ATTSLDWMALSIAAANARHSSSVTTGPAGTSGSAATASSSGDSSVLAAAPPCSCFPHPLRTAVERALAASRALRASQGWHMERIRLHPVVDAIGPVRSELTQTNRAGAGTPGPGGPSAPRVELPATGFRPMMPVPSALGANP